MNNHIGAHQGLIQISGPDAKKFLQGQLTCDVEKIENNTWQLGAHCNREGRIISLFYMTRIDDRYFLLLPEAMIRIAIDALKKYAVFFKVSIAKENDISIVPATILNEDDYKLNQMDAGIAGIYPATSGKYLPHELDLPRLGGVSFDKGCFTGQEIIARMHYRGKVKNHLYRATTDAETLSPGIDVHDAKGIAGSIVDYCRSGYNQNRVLVLTDEASAQSGELHVYAAGLPHPLRGLKMTGIAE